MRRTLEDQAGISLVETIVSISILGVILTGLASVIVNSLRAVVASRHELAATAVGNQVLEEMRAWEYAALGHCDPTLTASSLDPFKPAAGATSLGVPHYLPETDPSGIACDGSESTQDLLDAGLVPTTEDESRQGVSYTVTRHVLEVDEDADGAFDYKQLVVDVAWSDSTGDHERQVTTVRSPTIGLSEHVCDTPDILQAVTSKSPITVESIAEPVDQDGDGIPDDVDGDGIPDEVKDALLGLTVPAVDPLTGLPTLVNDVVNGELAPAVDLATGGLIGLNGAFNLSVTTCGLEFTDQVTVELRQEQQCVADPTDPDGLTCTPEAEPVTLATQAGLTSDGRVWKFTFAAEGLAPIAEGVPIDLVITARDAITMAQDTYIEAVPTKLKNTAFTHPVAIKNFVVKHADESQQMICVGAGNKLAKDLVITATVVGVPNRVQVEFLAGQQNRDRETYQLQNTMTGNQDKTIEVKWEATLSAIDDRWVFKPGEDTVFVLSAQREDGSSDAYPPLIVPVVKWCT